MCDGCCEVGWLLKAGTVAPDELRMPMQDGPDVAENVGRAFYELYSYMYGTDQSYERIVERRGFGYDEIKLIVDYIRDKGLRELEREGPPVRTTGSP